MRISQLILYLVIGLTAPDLAHARNDPVRAWMNQNAVPLNTVHPGSGGEDLAPLGEMVGDAHIVGLGEPTHGNHEIYRLKHRMFEYLVREKGFTHLGMELPFAETEYLNEFVLNGAGSAEEALSYTTMWASDVEEVAALLDWMREWNTRQPPDRQLRVFGFDMQSPERAAREVLEALDEANADLARDARRDLGTLALPFLDSDTLGYRPISPGEFDDDALATAQAIVRVLDSIGANRAEPIEPREFARLRHLARNLLWWVEANHIGGKNYSRIRDFAQAENVDWTLAQAGENSKVALWAHNVHVANLNSERLDGVDMAGRYLKRRHGRDYVIIGTFYANGQITALEASPWGSVRSFDTGRTDSDFLEARMPSDGPAALLDLSKLPDEGPVRDWFYRPQRTRHSGGGYSDDGYAYATFDYILPETFDIIAVVQDSTPTRPISPRDTIASRPLPRAANLGFEDVDEGVPRDWSVWSKQTRWGYHVAAISGDAPHGDRFARICRRAGTMGAEGTGSLVQYVDVRPHRGRELNVSAMTRVEPDKNSRAFLRIKVSPDPGDSAHAESETPIDTLDSIRIDHENWRRKSATVRIPDHAGYIMFGVNLIGDGCVSIDDVVIEILDKPASDQRE